MEAKIRRLVDKLRREVTHSALGKLMDIVGSNEIRAEIALNCGVEPLLRAHVVEVDTLLHLVASLFYMRLAALARTNLHKEAFCNETFYSLLQRSLLQRNPDEGLHRELVPLASLALSRLTTFTTRQLPFLHSLPEVALQQLASDDSYNGVSQACRLVIALCTESGFPQLPNTPQVSDLLVRRGVYLLRKGVNDSDKSLGGLVVLFGFRNTDFIEHSGMGCPVHRRTRLLVQLKGHWRLVGDRNSWVKRCPVELVLPLIQLYLTFTVKYNMSCPLEPAAPLEAAALVLRLRLKRLLPCPTTFTPLMLGAVKGRPNDLHFVGLEDTCLWGATALELAAFAGRISTTRALLKAGAQHRSALHMAVSRGHIKVALLLLQNGADPNLSAQPLGKPLEMAVKAHNFPMTRLLLKAGALRSAVDVETAPAAWSSLIEQPYKYFVLRNIVNKDASSLR